MTLAFHSQGCGFPVIWGPGRVLTGENGRSQERVRSRGTAAGGERSLGRTGTRQNRVGGGAGVG